MSIIKRLRCLFIMSIVIAGVIWTTASANVINVKSYGAVGDGKTNDTAAIQAAVEAIQKEGGVVSFPKGEYLISAPVHLYDGVSISGIGKASKLCSTMTGENDCFFYGEGLEDISITNMAFTSIGEKTTAVYLKGCTYVDISDLYAEKCGVVRLTAMNKDNEKTLCSNVFVKNIMAFGNGADTTAINVEDTRDLVVTGHIIDGYSNGVSIVNTNIVNDAHQEMINIVCSDSVFTDIKKDAVLINGTERTAIGGHDIKNAGTGIKILNPLYISVTNNVISDTTDVSILLGGKGDGVNINSNAVYSKKDNTCLLKIEGSEIPNGNRAVNITANTFHNEAKERSYICGGGVDVLSINSNHFFNTYIDMAVAPVRSTVISGNQMVFEGEYEKEYNAIKAGKTVSPGQLMIQNNHITSINRAAGTSTGIIVVQDDAEYSAASYIKNNSVRGFPVSIKTFADSKNVAVKPFFLVKGNHFGGIFYRDEGHTQSSVVVLEDNRSVSTGGNFPAAIPTEGKWEKGQIVYFDQPKPGEYVGAVCIAKGTPGIWKYFGQIDK